jgi:hypothetical protein
VLRVLEALVLAGDDSAGQPLDALLAHFPEGTREPAREAAQALVAAGLVWGDDDGLHVVAPVLDAVGRRRRSSPVSPICSSLRYCVSWGCHRPANLGRVAPSPSG